MYNIAEKDQDVNTCTLEKLQVIDELSREILNNEPFSPDAVAAAFGVPYYQGGLEDAMSLKPRTVKLSLISLENCHGFAVGVSDPDQPVQLLPYCFATAERAVLFGLLSWRYRDMLALAVTGAVGNA